MQENMKSNYLKTPFIEEIAVKMRMHGFNRSTKEVETRLRTMKCSYTRIIKDLDAGWIRKPTWKFFDDVHAILGSSVIKKEQFNQSAEPLDLSTSPTIKPDVHNLNCINPTAKAVIKRINSRTNMKKWIPVPLRIVKGETTTSQIPILTPQHPVPSNIHVNNDTSTEQVVLINENNNNSTETPIIRKKPSLLRDALENKDESNLGKSSFQLIEPYVYNKNSFQYQSTKRT